MAFSAEALKNIWQSSGKLGLSHIFPYIEESLHLIRECAPSIILSTKFIYEPERIECYLLIKSWASFATLSSHTILFEFTPRPTHAAVSVHVYMYMQGDSGCGILCKCMRE